MVCLICSKKQIGHYMQLLLPTNIPQAKFNNIHKNPGNRYSQVMLAYHTDLAVTSLCMVVKEIHDPQICPNLKLKLLVRFKVL